ncbi:murein biosynthesis integral membrane protein MurJ [Crossiella cryophila]
MAVATLISRITGFFAKLSLAWVVGLSANAINDSYTVANTVPNIVYELLLGGVLTSVVVPTLVRARAQDADGGEAYAQRLLTVGGTVLTVVTVLAVCLAPVVTAPFVDNTGGTANPALVTAFAYLLLPEIVFYGLFAMFGAVLNARGVFGPPAWAPVLNNLVLIATIGLYFLLPGQIATNPVELTNPKLLVLGLGTTLGILVQAGMLIPSLRRSGFRLRWRWGWDRRLAEFGGLALWVLGYVLLSQLGYLVISRVATSTAAGGISVYTYAWLLVQMPYGVLGVSLLTALLPRMSHAAAINDRQALAADLSLGSRLSAVMLGPVSGLLTVLGPAVGVALFSIGEGSADADRLGLAITASAFGLLPFGLTMLQLRACYAMNDARTPTVINLLMVAVRIPLCLLAADLLPAREVVYGLAFANAVSFVVGAVAGELWLRRRLVPSRGERTVRTYGRVAAATGCAVGIGWLARLVVAGFVPGGPEHALGAWIWLVGGGGLGLLGAVGTLVLLRVDEVRSALARFTPRRNSAAGRRSPR